MTFTEICDFYHQKGRAIVTAKGENGCLCAIPEGGRILSLAFTPEDQSLFFINLPPHELPGGPGGDRIRFAPEYAFAWEGKERDTIHFSNYRQQENEEPGTYSLEAVGETIVHRMETNLLDRITGTPISFSVERVVQSASCPICLPDGVRYAGYRSRSRLSLDTIPKEGPIGLWFLLQVEAESTLLVPLTRQKPPMEYFNTGTWQLRPGAMLWNFNGTSKAKIGYDTATITGRTGVVRKTGDDTWVLLIRKFSVREDMYYCDGLSPEEAGDQVFQAWDGFGFGEMEYHTPGAGESPLPDSIDDESLLWAFEGSLSIIADIAADLLKISWV